MNEAPGLAKGTLRCLSINIRMINGGMGRGIWKKEKGNLNSIMIPPSGDWWEQIVMSEAPSLAEGTLRCLSIKDENPNTHLANFLELYDTFKINGVSNDAIRLRSFPFSLKNKAKQWLNSLPRGSITTWQQITKKFLLKYFSPTKTAKLRNDISFSVQMDLETLYDAWKRYKDLLRRCPHHGLPLWLQVQTFYNGVNPSTRQIIDAAAGGTINNKTPEEAYEFIEEMSLNNYQWQVMRTKPTKTAGVYNIDSVNMLTNQVELLNKKIDGLLGSIQVSPVMRCDSSGRGVHTEYQSFNPSTEEEQVHYMDNNNSRTQNNPYSNTYNAGWRNYPNFSWGGQGNQRPQNPLGFQQPPYQQEKKSNLEEMLTNFISMSETRFQSSLPSNTGSNPREQLNAINVQDEEGLIEPKPEPRQGIMMPNAMKFLTKILANKRKLDAASHVKLNAVCSTILQNKLPNKLKDPGSFTIPCLIGSLSVKNALADLGANINVMPYKIFKQLSLGKPKQTSMSIQLADKTIRFRRGIIEDLLVKIDKFIFPIDFVVLDIEENSDVPLILGRPFLATARTIINVGTGELTLRVGDETITLQAHNSSNEGGSINHATDTDHMVQPTLQKTRLKSIKKPCLRSNKGPMYEERRLQIEKLDE
ncbi:hypothetical protein CXB51_023321 [Gossypium anomalum]|uniref:Retrotransposon gag domain-containing protein n=1 Tax=Gossypium anomalum TaxID=47600 RepID=A0A8J5YW57_9ROSI|nr:hypothetical protein CXB51_023321 [Gossypium anomalum]